MIEFVISSISGQKGYGAKVVRYILIGPKLLTANCEGLLSVLVIFFYPDRINRHSIYTMEYVFVEYVFVGEVWFFCALVTWAMIVYFLRCCSFCGRVVSEDNWSEEVTFAKDAGGQVCHCSLLLLSFYIFYSVGKHNCKILCLWEIHLVFLSKYFHKQIVVKKLFGSFIWLLERFFVIAGWDRLYINWFPICFIQFMESFANSLENNNRWGCECPSSHPSDGNINEILELKNEGSFIYTLPISHKLIILLLK